MTFPRQWAGGGGPSHSGSGFFSHGGWDPLAQVRRGTAEPLLPLHCQKPREACAEDPARALQLWVSLGSSEPAREGAERCQA